MMMTRGKGQMVWVMKDIDDGYDNYDIDIKRHISKDRT